MGTILLEVKAITYQKLSKCSFQGSTLKKLLKFKHKDTNC